MKGTVTFFNIAAALGFILGKDGVQYFVHESKIRMGGLRLLVPGWDVEFEPEKDDRGRDGAINVVPLEMPGLAVRPGKAVQLPKGGVAPIVVGLEHEAASEVILPVVKLVLDKKVLPEVEASEINAYRVSGRVNSFSVSGDGAGLDWVVLVLDKATKRVSGVFSRQAVYSDVVPGSYLMYAHRSGHVVIWTVGRRAQAEAGPRGAVWDNWVTIQTRFEHPYQIETGAPSLVEQTPENNVPGLERTNVGFVPAIASALEALARLNQENE